MTLTFIRYQVAGKKKSECESGGDVRPVTDVQRESVDGVESRRERHRQRQKRTQNVRFVAGRDNIVHVYLHMIISIIANVLNISNH